jgi:DNA mismatch repair protein MutL
VRRALGTLDSAADVGGRVWFAGGGLTRSNDLASAHPWGARDVSALELGRTPADGLFATPPIAGVEPRDARDPRGFDGAPVGAPALPWEQASSAPALAVDGAQNAASAEAERSVVVPPLVQLRRTYLLFERDEGVVLIDQHSAHERVLYERFMGALERGESPSQRLLFPLTLHLGPAQGDAFEAHRDALTRLGYEVEPFGGGSLLVHAVPAPHPRFDAERCLRETLDALTGDRHAATHARHERLAATVACKAAIKAGDALSPDEMRALFVALARTTLPAHDVHGRATIVHVGWDELERRFGRT